jgi:antitoxin YefM
MNSKTTISISEARRRIFDIAEEVQKPNTHYTFTENGKPKAVLMSAGEFDSLMEDFEILNDPGLFARIQEAEKEIARGDYVTLDELKKNLNYVSGDGLVVADKNSRTYSAKKKVSRGRK